MTIKAKMTVKAKFMAGFSAATLAIGVQAAFAGGHGEFTVVYFLEWSMPFEYATQMVT